MDLELYIERIERYESNAMSVAERRDFEAELAANNDLQEALALYRQSNEVIEQGVENQLRAQLQEWAQAETQAPTVASKKVSMNVTWGRLAIAASVALLLGWFGWQYTSSQYTDSALYAAYYEKPVTSNLRSGANTAHPFQAGFEALESNNGATAVNFFSAITNDNERYAEAQYYLGHSYLSLKQYDSAIAAFQRCADSQDIRFQEKGAWNMLLTYVAAGRTEDPVFKALLQAMAGSPDNGNQAKAKKLQQQLNSIWR